MIKNIMSVFYDVMFRPMITQIVKIGTNRQDGLDIEKFKYDVISRAITAFIPSPWKSFYRGGVKSLWDLKNKGYFE